MLTVHGPQPPNWNYPTTQKQLAGFPAPLSLVELGRSPKHVAVRVADKAQGEAVVARLAKTAPAVRAALYCHVPTAPLRTIDVAAP